MMVFFILSLFLQTIHIEAEATGVDKESACDRAKQRAMQKAVEQEMGVFVRAETLVKHNDVLRESVYRYAEGFIARLENVKKNSQKIAGSKDIACTVTLDAEVASKKLASAVQKLEAALNNRNKPKVLLLLNVLAVETALLNAMQQQGFTFVDAEIVRSKLALNPSTETLISLGELAAAEVVVYGQVDFNPKHYSETDLTMVEAQLAMRAVFTDNAEAIAASTLHAEGSAYNEGLAKQRAAELLATIASKDIVEKITEVWLKEIHGSKRLAVTLENVKNYQTVLAFQREILQAVESVITIYPRTFSKNKATFDIQSEVLGDQFAKALVQQKFKLRIKEVSANTIMLELP